MSRLAPWPLALFALAAATLIPTGADAQEIPPVNIQQFRLAPGPADYLTVYGTGLTPHLKWTAGFFLNMADAPLRQPSADSLDAEVVDFQVAGDLIGTFGLYDLAEIGVGLPVTFFQSSDDLTPVAGAAFTGELSAAALGDLRLSPKITALNLLDGVGLSFIPVLYVPTGGSGSFNGDGNVTAEGRVAADFLLPKGIRVGSNAGFRFRPEGRRIRDAFVGNEILWGVSTILPLWAERIDLMVEFNGAVPAGSGPLDEINDGSIPAEALAAVRYALDDDWTLTVGAGSRLSNGYGSPNGRFFVGLGGQWVTGGKWHWDYDNDGFLGANDQCPDESEDLDGFLDTDGCPDPDNDGDGIPDSRDRCPMAGAEGIIEVGPDGCPDNDIDGDHIFNDKDKCPEDPEDLDGFQDIDGCPDPDNDGDGIADRADSCPDTAETVDGVVDDDGCPELPGQTVIVTKAKIEILQQVLFDSGKSTIKKDSFKLLADVAEALRRNPDIKVIQVQGHTDDRGNDANNLKLSQRRAAAVVDHLVNEGIEAERLTSVGYGEEKPITTNDTNDGRTRNRRVEFHIIDRGARERFNTPKRDTIDTGDDLF